MGRAFEFCGLPVYDVIQHKGRQIPSILLHRLMLPLTTGRFEINKTVVGVHMDPEPLVGRPLLRECMEEQRLTGALAGPKSSDS